MELNKLKESFPFWSDWKEVAFQYNTGKEYQDKQDLISVFYNGYSMDIKSRIPHFVDKFGYFPLDELNALIFEFRQFFPKKERISGVNYFDDLIELYIESEGVKEIIQNGNDENKTLRNITKDLFDGKAQAFRSIIESKIGINPIPLLSDGKGDINREFLFFLMGKDQFGQMGYNEFLNHNFKDVELENLLVEFSKYKADSINERIDTLENKPIEESMIVENVNIINKPKGTCLSVYAAIIGLTVNGMKKYAEQIGYGKSVISKEVTKLNVFIAKPNDLYSYPHGNKKADYLARFKDSLLLARNEDERQKIEKAIEIMNDLY